LTISPISKYGVSIEQYNYLRTIACDLSMSDYKLFCHIFVSTTGRFRQVQDNGNGWLAIPRRFIQDTFRTSDPSHLQHLNLIEISRAYVVGKHPKKYRLKGWILEEYVQASIHKNEPDGRLVSIVTGKPIPEHTAEPLNEPSIPLLIQKAIERFRICYFNRPAVLEHLARLRASYEHTPTTRNRFRYLNDWFIMDTIDKLAHPVTDKPQIYSYKPRYTMQVTGRIGAPMQSCSRAMKQAAYSSIKGIYNYDITSSQMALCRSEFELYRIPCPWLQTYMNDPNKRAEYAGYIGISIAVWKECLYAILMTGHIPTNTAWKDSPVVEALENEITDPVELSTALGRLQEVLNPLVKSLQQWRKIIELQAQHEGGVSNMFGIKRPSHQFDKTSGMVAHLLQGMEAYFIHLLTVLSYQYGFEPISNEHDGLITIGPIPDEAIQEARNLTGLHCLELREKPFN
jgi:hypothetical protein